MEELKKILVVDDSTDVLSIITGILSGSYKVYPVNSGAVAMKFLERNYPDLILLDITMPGLSGIEIVKMLKADPKLKDIPVIFLTAVEDSRSEAYALELGAVDYIHKPINSVVMQARIKLHLELESYRKNLQQLVDQKTSQILLMQDITINLLAFITEYRDKETGSHVKRTEGYVCAIMDNLPKDKTSGYYISPEYYDNIKKSAPLHDIGKISVPDSILLKPGSLTSDEFETIKKHVTSGADLLQNAIKEFNGPSFLDVALEIVLTHHEKWDGTGYPNHLKNDSIPLSGRIMALADVYDALTSQRPYKEPMPHKEAMEIILNSSGKHFDPVLVDVFANIQNELMRIHNLCETDSE